MAIESDVAAHLHPDIVIDPNIGLTLQGAEKNSRPLLEGKRTFKEYSRRTSRLIARGGPPRRRVPR